MRRASIVEPELLYNMRVAFNAFITALNLYIWIALLFVVSSVNIECRSSDNLDSILDSISLVSKIKISTGFLDSIYSNQVLTKIQRAKFQYNYARVISLSDKVK